MTIGNALLFIRKGISDSSFRKRFNSAETISDLQAVLDMENFSFSISEFEDAFNHQLLKCQHEDDAGLLQEFRLWWEMVSGSLSKPGCRVCSDKC